MKPDFQNTALLLLALLLQDFSQEIRKLGADSPDERAAAEDALVQAGDAAVPHLAEAYPTTDDPEVQTRLRSALKRIGAATLDYLDRRPVKGLESLGDEICADHFKPYAPTERLEYVSIEYGKPPAVAADKLVVRYEKGSDFTALRLGEAGLIVDRVSAGAKANRVQRAVIAGSTGRMTLRLLLFAASMSVKRSVFSGGWGSSGKVQIGARILEGDRELFRRAYWGRPGSSAQPKYMALQVMDRILDDALKGAKWEDRELSAEFREDLRERASWYLLQGKESGVDEPPAAFERMKDLLGE